MAIHDGNPALDAELAYRRQRLQAARAPGGPRIPWLPTRRRENA